MRGRMVAFVVAMSTVAAAPLARAEEPALPEPRAAAPVGARPALLPVPQRLQLQWPLAPRSFSFRAFDAGSSATGPLAAFEARSVWFQSGRLSLATLSSALPSAALDCSGLTCQPTLLRSLGVEARLQLYSGPVVREAYAYTRYEAQQTTSNEPSMPHVSGKRARVLSFGLGGALDL